MPTDDIEALCTRLKVLVVDDDADVVDLVDAVLQSLKVPVVWTAADGDKAWTIFEKAGDQIDLIVCDWMMPGLSGLELLRRVRASESVVPFLMLTARTTADAVAQARDAGVDAYMVKPFDPRALRDKILALVTPPAGAGT